MTPEERARKSAECMHSNDNSTKWAGISIDEVRPGWAQASMPVEDHHLNGHHVCHGGLIFMLADTAFAFACNSYNTNVLAQLGSITFLSPGQKGETLVAEAVEQTRAGRSGIYDVTVTGGDGRKVAMFRGHSRQIPGTHFEEEDA